MQHFLECFYADERESHGDPIDAEKKAQRPIRRGQEVLSLNNIHQGVTAKGP